MTRIIDQLTDFYNDIVLDRKSPLSVRSLLLVGGESGSTGIIDVEDGAVHLWKALALMTHKGIPFHPDITFRSLNLKQGNGDFLASPPPADLVVTCFIYNPPEEEGVQTLHYPDNTRCSCISPHHHVAGIWAEKAKEAGARYIVTCCNSEEEINADHFNHPPYTYLAKKRWLDMGAELLVRQDVLPLLNRRAPAFA